MFWDIAANFYDKFENFVNKDVNIALTKKVTELVDSKDDILECACGTGMISNEVAKHCKTLTATDYSKEMLKIAQQKCVNLRNVTFAFADITDLHYQADKFDKVLAGNIIHLLNQPKKAMKELERVCKPGGKIILPTYISKQDSWITNLLNKILGKTGTIFKQLFNYRTYQEFFKNMGYKNIEFYLIEGKMPCAIAVITKEK